MENEQVNKNWDYVMKNYSYLLNVYRNKYILVVHSVVVGSFDNYQSAANEGIKNYGINSGFLVQYITEKEPTNIVISALL